MIHIGERIREELRKDGHSIVWFAKELNCNRQNVYDIFKRRSIDTQLLHRISKILHHDFFSDCSANLGRDRQD